MSLKDFGTAFFAIFLIASNLVLLKKAHEYCSVDIFNTIRFSLFIFIIPFLKFPKSKWRHLLIYSFFNCFLNFAFIALAISSDVQISYIGLSSIPRIIFITIFAFLIINEKISLYQFSGILISCITLFIFKVGMTDPGETLGLIYIALSGLSWAIAFTLIKKNKLKFTLSEICYANAFAAPMMFTYTYFMHGNDFVLSDLPIDTNFILMILYSAFIPILFATFLWQQLSLKYESIKLNPIMNFLPFMVFFEAILFLDEPFSSEFLILLTAMFFALMMCQNINPFARLKRSKS